MSYLLLIFVLLSLIIVLIIHCYCLWPSTRIVQHEFRKIPAFMWGGRDCEEMFVQLGGTTYLSCDFCGTFIFCVLQDHLQNCLLTLKKEVF